MRRSDQSRRCRHVIEERPLADDTPSVLFTEAESLQPAFVNLVLNAAIPSGTVRGFISESIAKSGQTFASLDQLLGMLRGFFAGNLDGAFKNAPLGHLNADLLEQGAHFARYERQFLTETNRYKTEVKPNPDAVFWPNPAHPTLARPLIGAVPHAGNIPLVDKSTPIGSAGSCFASEIAYYLQLGGYNYVVTESDPRDGELPESSARWGIIFNTPSIQQLAEKAFGLRDLPRLVEQRVDGDYFQDPYRENIGFDSIDELEANRAAHITACRRAFEEVEVFILTLGLNECWQFIPDGSVISRGPKTSHHFALFRHRVLSVDENLACLQRFLDVVRAHNPALKLIVTVSPVPLLATGLADDTHVIAANGHSKAVLRTAAEELRRRNDGVYYFPSYEMVSYCLNDPWEDDTRHVKRAAVAQIMTAFKAAFAKPV